MQYPRLDIHVSELGEIPPLNASHRKDLYTLGGILFASLTAGLAWSCSYLRLCFAITLQLEHCSNFCSVPED